MLKLWKANKGLILESMSMYNQYKAIKSFLFSKASPFIRVSSNSMQPMLTAGQRIMVKPVNKPLKQGLCYVYVCQGGLHIHRLLWIKNQLASFIGDSSQKRDTVSLEAIVAQPVLMQHSFTIVAIRNINLLFSKIISLIPSIGRLRVALIRFINTCERFAYEKKV